MFFHKKKSPRIYLDHAATTPLDRDVLRAMLPYFGQVFGNASALYDEGVVSKNSVQSARLDIANEIHTQPDTIIFTSGGTESDNLAILGVARANRAHGRHVVTSQIEHHAVLSACAQLEREGFEVTYLPVDSKGLLDSKTIKSALRPDTILVSIMSANNEVGSILPIADIGRAILRFRLEQKSVYPYFHTDACQAAAYLNLDVEKTHVDLLTLNGAKIYGPKGTGILYVRRGVKIEPILFGGGQEFGKRSGTENVAGIIGLATALRLVVAHRVNENIQNLRDQLYTEITQKVKRVVLNGPEVDSGSRLVNNLNLSFLGVDSEAMILYLNARGIAVSSGSACATGNDEGSHVLQALGKNESEVQSAIRFTLGKDTTSDQISKTAQAVKEILDLLQ